MKELIKLSLDDIDVIRDNTEDDGSIDFALARLKFMGTSINEDENSQGYILSEEVLKKHAETALGKLITGKVNPYSKDLMSHESAPLIFGYIPPNSQITFEQDGSRWFAICEAVISKIYCKDVVDAFKYDNDRCVSIEASIESSPNNPKEIESFSIHSITILSKIIRGAVKGANMEIIKFSSEMAEEYYNQHTEDPLKKFAEDRKNKMKTNPKVRKDKLGLKEDGKDKEEEMVKEDIKEPNDKKVELAEENKDIIMGSDEGEETDEMKCSEDETVALAVDTEPEKQLGKETKEPQDAKNSKQENEAKWSIDEIGVLVADSSVKDTVLGFFSEDSIEGLVSKIVEFAKEKEELEKDKANSDKEKADVKFSQIMAMAKLKLDNTKYDEVYKQGQTLKFSELEAFERDVKACICDTVLFSDTIESNPNISFGTHLKQTETKSNGLWS